MSAIYIFAGPAGDAARHLVDHSALRYCTTVEDVYYADADCTKVTMASPRPSEGERILWDAAHTLANESGMVDINAAAQVIDAENLRVLHEAIGMRFGVASDSLSLGQARAAIDAILGRIPDRAMPEPDSIEEGTRGQLGPTLWFGGNGYCVGGGKVDGKPSPIYWRRTSAIDELLNAEASQRAERDWWLGIAAAVEMSVTA